MAQTGRLVTLASVQNGVTSRKSSKTPFSGAWFLFIQFANRNRHTAHTFCTKKTDVKCNFWSILAYFITVAMLQLFFVKANKLECTANATVYRKAFISASICFFNVSFSDLNAPRSLSVYRSDFQEHLYLLKL